MPLSDSKVISSEDRAIVGTRSAPDELARLEASKMLRAALEKEAAE